MIRTLVCSVLCLGLLAGCSGGTGKEPTYKVSGKVTYKGQPIPGADITFYCSEKERSAFGRTNDVGEFELTTFSSNDGAVEGKHAVTIVQLPPAPSTPTNIAPIESENYVPPKENEFAPPPKEATRLPAKYADQASSGLIAVVNKEGDNVINFELKD